MSLLKHNFFPRSMFGSDAFSSLDLFDPFDDLDRMMVKNFRWLNRPGFLTDIIPEIRVPHRYRVDLDVHGFDPKSIKTEVSKDHTKLIITAKEGERKTGDEDYALNELKRTYNLPQNAEVDKLASFVTSSGKLIVEIPLKIDHGKKAGKAAKGAKALTEGAPKVVEDEKGNKTVQLNLTIPGGIDPSKVKVTCKDRDIIVQAEESNETKDESSRVFYYKRCTLPESTNIDMLKCVCEKDHLMITAPVEPQHEHGKRTIPIEIKGNNKKLKEN